MRTLRDRIDELEQEMKELLRISNSFLSAADLQDDVAAKLATEADRLLARAQLLRGKGEVMQVEAAQLQRQIDELEREADRRES